MRRMRRASSGNDRPEWSGINGPRRGMNSFAIRTPRKMGRLWRWTSRSRMDCSIQVTRRVPPRKSSIVAAQPFQFLTNNGGLIMAEEAVHKGVVVQVKSTDDPDVLHMVGST